MLLIVALSDELHFLILCFEGFFFLHFPFFRHYFSLKFQQSFSVFPRAFTLYLSLTF